MLASGLGVYRSVMVKNTQGTASACPSSPLQSGGGDVTENRPMLHNHVNCDTTRTSPVSTSSKK